MRSQLKVLALALSLSALPVPHLSAQPPVDPPPRVELQEVFVVGSDLAATFNWSNAVAPLPPGARLKLLDAQGREVGSVSFAPVVGSQTVWIPGGALPRVGTTETWPLERQIELLGSPSREILVEKGVSVHAGGPVVILSPRWPLPLATGRHCYLHVDSFTCDDSEDHGGDEIYMDMGDDGYWYGPADVRGGTTFNLGWVYMVCDTCKNLQKTITFKLLDLDDPGFPLFDDHDFLGSGQAGGCTVPSPPQQEIKFSGSNYTYWLRYHLACYEVDCP
jgi:hypothetical protein